jgi:hypothetical protein
MLSNCALDQPKVTLEEEFMLMLVGLAVSCGL